MPIVKTQTQLSIEANTGLAVDASLGTMLHNPDSISQHGATLCEPGAPAAVYSAGRTALCAFGRELAAMVAADKAMRVAPPLKPGAEGRAQLAQQEIRPGSPMPAWPVLADKVEDFIAGLNASFTRAGKSFDAAREKVVESLGILDRTIASAVSDPSRDKVSVASQGVETRGLVRSLKGEARMGAVADFIKDKDHRSVAAVLDASPALSGLTRDQHNILRAMAESAFAADAVRHRDAARGVLNHLDSAAVDFSKRYSNLVPKQTAQRAASVDSTLDMLRSGAKAAA